MKISIIGAGNVGSITALRIAQEGLGEIVLIDVVKGLAQGKAFDLEDARPILKYNYQIEGSDDINKIKESLTFEYAHYGSNQLTLYVMNSGAVNVTIKNVSINNSPVLPSALTIYPMSGTQPISNNVPIIKGTEVKIVLDLMASGWTVEKILSEYNQSHLKPEAIREALRLAGNALLKVGTAEKLVA